MSAKFKDNIHQFLEQISNTIFVFIYTIFFIIFFLDIPSDVLNKYGYIITPLTILLTGYMFYKGSSTNYIENFNINYERIKTIILFFNLKTMKSLVGLKHTAKSHPKLWRNKYFAICKKKRI